MSEGGGSAGGDGGGGAAADSVSNDQKLAHFQEVTHLDDFEQCQAILESTNWDLDQAIQSYFTTQFSTNEPVVGVGGGIGVTTSTNITSNQNVDNNDPYAASDDEIIDVNLNEPGALASAMAASGLPMRPHLNIPSAFSTFEHQQETLNSFFNNLSTQNFGKAPVNKRLLTFNLDYLNEHFTLYVPDTETVDRLKQLVEEKIGVERKHIKLNGWPTNRLAGGSTSAAAAAAGGGFSRSSSRFISDRNTLSELNLPLVTNLRVVNMQTLADDMQNTIAHLPGAGFATASSSTSYSLSGGEPDTFELYIKIVQSGDEKIHRLHFGRETTFVEIRRRLTALTGLIANDQEWWYYKPPSSRAAMSDDDQLADFKSINSLEKFIEAQNSEKLLGIPLDSIAEDGFSIARIKSLLDELLSSQPSPPAVETKTTSKSTSTSTSLASTSSSASKNNNNNKLMFIINNRSPINDSTAVNPSTSGLTNESQQQQQRKGSLPTDYVLVPDTNLADEYEADDAMMMSSTHEDDLDEHFLVNDDSDNAAAVNKRKALITTDCPVGNEFEATNMFRDEFASRYGPMMPLFYLGKLEDAIRDALVCPARDRRLLGIYLHSDNTVFCNIFAAKTLCDETVINFLSSNFVVWPWDLTVKAHEHYFYEMCAKFFGSTIASKLRQHHDKLPLFLIVTRVRATNEIVAIVEGDLTSDMMMQRLMQCSEMFENQRVNDERDERERDERERIKREQDQAYRESLENDKAKRQRHAAEEEEKKIAREKAEQEERRRVEGIERRKADALARLAPEPDASQPQVARIRFRLPDGETWQRRFHAKDKLESVIDFMTSQGYFVDDYKLLSSWPRRDLTTESSEKTLEELKLYPQETLTLEQR